MVYYLLSSHFRTMLMIPAFGNLHGNSRALSPKASQLLYARCSINTSAPRLWPWIAETFCETQLKVNPCKIIVRFLKSNVPWIVRWMQFSLCRWLLWRGEICISVWLFWIRSMRVLKRHKTYSKSVLLCKKCAEQPIWKPPFNASVCRSVYFHRIRMAVYIDTFENFKFQIERHIQAVAISE